MILTEPVTDFLGVYKDISHGLVYWSVRILAITIIYQITLVIIGSLFGQKRFFCEMEKKFLAI